MAIIGTLPNNLANGTIADASQVMADLNFIINQVNANAQPAGNYSTLGTLDAPSGTRMLFHQAAAPTGWVIDTTINDCSVQVNSSGGGVVTNQAGIGDFLGGNWGTGGHTLTAAEIPAHTHNTTLYSVGGSGAGTQGVGGASPAGFATTDGGTGGSQAHTHPISQKWNYIAICVAQKS